MPVETDKQCACASLIADLLRDRADLLVHIGYTESEWAELGGSRFDAVSQGASALPAPDLASDALEAALPTEAQGVEAARLVADDSPVRSGAALSPVVVPLPADFIPPLPPGVASVSTTRVEFSGAAVADLFQTAHLGTAPARVVLTEEQQEALCKIDEWYEGGGQFYALTGPAGVGKSTILREVHDLYDPALTAMTGKAALRLEQVTCAGASTLHKLMYYPPKAGEDVRFNRLRDPPGTLVVVDESSMMGPSVFADLRRWGARALLVGDIFQLPPVVTGEDLKEYGEDYSVFARVSGTELLTVMRNAGGVLRAATQVRLTGNLFRASDLDAPGSGYEYLCCANPVERAVEEYLADPDDHLLITWKNSVRMNSNRVIRERLGHSGPLPDEGEPVLIRKNGQGRLNGEIVPCGTFKAGPTIGSMRTLWMTVQGSQAEPLLVSFEGGNEDRGGEFFDGQAPWVTDWRAYNVDLRSKMLPEPVPITWGYCLTAHACVHPETLVETPSGLVRIRKIAKIGQIATPSGLKPYENLVTNPIGPMLRIRTKDGYTLDVTPEHGIFVWDGEDYSRIEAREAKPGLQLQFRLGATCDPTELRALPKAGTHADGTLDTRAVEHRIPTVVDGDVAEFFGMMVADGTLFDRGVRLVKRHRDVVLRFRELAESIFGVEVNDENALDYENPDVTGVSAHSVQISRWLARLGGMSPKEKDVPECVLESPLAVQARFLRGLFEDGTVNLSKKTGEVDHIEWTTCRESLATTVHVMLLRFGIIAARTQRGPDEEDGQSAQHAIYIYGKNALRFRDQIGFISKWKQDRLVDRGGDAREVRYSAPFSRSEITAVRSFLSRTERSNWHANRCLSRNVMRLAISRGASGQALQILEEKLRWHHSPIVSVEPVADAPSMCVTVPDGNRFLQNGSPQSNSQGSQARRTTVFLERGDDRSRNFNKPTTLPSGEVVSFGARWCYTAQTRSRIHTKMIVG